MLESRVEPGANAARTVMGLHLHKYRGPAASFMLYALRGKRRKEDLY